jgi:hypothetical protein
VPWSAIVLCLLIASSSPGSDAPRHAVTRDHPRLLGSRAELKQLAKDRAADYQRMTAVARGKGDDAHTRIISLALTAAIEEDASLAQEAKKLAMKYVTGPILRGHVPFASDLALSGLV